MDFEDILKEVGGSGLYQKLLILAYLLPSYIVIPWFSMNMVFMSNTPEHWCFVPEVANSHLSVNLQKQLIRPPDDSSCSMYDVNYSQILSLKNWTIDSKWPTKHCQNGWQYDTTDYDATAVTKWSMVCKDSHYSSLVLSLIFVGNIFGTPVYGYMSDKLGRRTTFFILAVIVAVTEISSVFIPNFALFLILRTINGSVMASIYGVGYVILLELVNPNIRSQVNMLATTFWTFGLCFLPLIAWLTRDWIYLSIVTTSCAIGLLLYWKALPESPSWLISQERYDEAVSIMKRISKVNGKNVHEGDHLQQRILKLGEKIKKQRATEEKHSPIDFFKYPTLRKRFFLITLCWVGNTIPYYGLQINVKNLAGSEFLNFFLLSLIEVPAHLVTWIFMEWIGRRWCSVLGFSIATITCMIPVIITSENEMVSIVASILAKGGSSSAFMTLFQQAPEIFPTCLRVVGMGMSRMIGMGSTLLVPYIVYLGKFGNFIPFLIFAIISFVGGICASFLPETLNRRLPQTVEDVENFERNFKFFSWKPQCETDLSSEKVQNNKTPSVLSSVDLSSSMKNVIVEKSTKDIPVSMKEKSSLPTQEMRNSVNPAA